MTIRLFQNEELLIGKTIILDERNTHHVGRVLRCRLNDELIIFNDTGVDYIANIIEITKKHITAHIVNEQVIANESPLTLHLVQSLVRGEKMDYILQKAVELGVQTITPIITNFSHNLSKDKIAKRIAHWQGVIIHACEQSGRSRLPVLYEPSSFQTHIKNSKSKIKLILSPHSQQQKLPTMINTSVEILIGPEGGFSEAEMNAAKTAGFIVLRLGPRVLRTETAGVVAVSILQNLYGDLSFKNAL